MRVSSEAHSAPLTTPDTTVSRHHHHHHHHHNVSLSASVVNSDRPLNSQIVIRPSDDRQLPVKRLHNSSPTVAVTSSKLISIDAPLEQLSLPPPLIPIPTTKHTASSTRSRTQSLTPQRSLPSIPPPVPVRRSVGNIRQTMSSAPPTVTAPVDSVVVSGRTESGEAPSNECVVCLELAPDSVLYTCGHMCMCYSCALDVVQNRDALCPICRQSIRDVIKIFRS